MAENRICFSRAVLRQIFRYAQKAVEPVKTMTFPNHCVYTAA